MSATQTAHAATVQLLPLAKELDENKVTPGVLGFIVFAALGAAVWMLMKSMNRHMAKIDFEEQPGEGTGTDGAPAQRDASPEPTPPSAPPPNPTT